MNVASVMLLLILMVAVAWALRILNRKGGTSCGSCNSSGCVGKQFAKTKTFDKCNCHK